MQKSEQTLKPEKIKKSVKRNPPKELRTVPTIQGVKYFTRQQIQLLRRTVRDLAAQGQRAAVREWALIDLMTFTGLRVSEAADLRCGSILVGQGLSAIFIRNGQGKPRTVQIPETLKKHLKAFLSWKKLNSEPVGNDDYLFVGQRGEPWSVQTIQQLITKCLKQVEIYEVGKGARCLRHSYGIELYRAEKDLLAVQQQLGHTSLETTKIYGNITQDDLKRQIKGLWNK